MYAYDELGKLVGEHNIMDLLNSAYCRSGGLYNFFHLLRCIMDQSYRPYIKQWPENAIDKEIEKLEVSGDSERGEMLCVLSAYLMIEHTDLSEKHKDFLEETAGSKNLARTHGKTGGYLEDYFTERRFGRIVQHHLWALILRR